jgi:hypothetical protein
MSSDISSQSVYASLSSSTQRLQPPNFHSIIRTELIGASTTVLPGRKRRSKGTTHYYCTICLDWPGTSHVRHAHDHVYSFHPLSNASSASMPTQAQPFLSSMWSPTASPDAMRNTFDMQRYKEALVGLLTRRRLPFSAVEWPEWAELTLACNPHIGDRLITSRRTAVRTVVSNYEFYTNQIKSSLATASSPIHIATDLWTSPHRHAMLAVCAQWVDKDYKLQKALLGLPECRYSHSGEQQAELILKVLENFGILSNLGWHTGDNATSNETCLEFIRKRLAKNGVRYPLFS